MGNINNVEIRRDHRISSIENLKQMQFDNQRSKKKKSAILSATWKRFVESTKKKGSKGSKINPAAYTDGGYPPQSKANINHQNTRQPNKEGKQKSQTQYVVNGKHPAGVANGIVDTKPVFPQPRQDKPRTNDSSKPTMQEQYKSLPAQQQARMTSANIKSLSRNENYSKPSSERNDSVQTKKSGPVSGHDNSKPTGVASKQTSSTAPPRKVVIQASTAELLDCLGEFICRRCHRIQELEPIDIITWIRSVDRALLMQGWQDITFIMPSSVCFVYMLCREMVPESVTSVYEVQCIVLTCLYMSYSYMGNEISYPLRPFLIEPERYAFWGRCCRIMNKLSGKMLRINNDAQFFTTVFRDLKAYSPRRNKPIPPTYTYSKAPSQQITSAHPIPVGGSGQ